MTAPARRRDASRSREQLLQAAVELFAERGYDGTTVRELGERAGVDPALIARYFGSKTALYIASVRAEAGAAPPVDLLSPGRLLALLERVRRRGAGPVFRAAVLPQDDADVAAAVGEHLRDRLVAPLVQRYERLGADRAQLRAEVAVAALTGVLLAKGAGTLGALQAVPDEELAALLDDLLAGLDGPDQRKT